MKNKLVIYVLVCLTIIITVIMYEKEIKSDSDSGLQPPKETQNFTEETTRDSGTTIETTVNPQETTQSTVNRPYKPINTDISLDDILKNSENRFYINVELNTGTITVYERSISGEFNQPVKSAPAATGTNGSTPTGIYFIENRSEWFKESTLGYTRFVSIASDNLKISSALYETTDINTLIRRSYNELGTPSTDGNIHTTADMAYWIYEYCPKTTIIHVTDKSIGNPVTSLRELNPDYTFTDPTDPFYKSLKILENNGILPYKIYVEKGSYSITVYGLDSNNEYTIPVRLFLTATGRTAGRTPVGTFKIGEKERWHQFAYNGGYAQYATSYYSNLYIHSPIYSIKQIDTMFKEFYEEIGTAATAGCLRTTSYASYWIYSYCPKGTIVEIVNGSPNGISVDNPPKIGDDYYTYDPTDPFNPNSVY